MPIILVIGAVIIALGVGAFVFFSSSSSETNIIQVDEVQEIAVPEPIRNSSEEADESEDQTETAPSPESADSGQSGLTGTFSTDSSYLTPRRTEHTVELTLTVENDVVTDAVVTFDGNPAGQYSNDNQARFDAAYQSEVIGKSLDDIALSRVGGASLTSQAFNEAVAEVKTQTS